MVLEELTRLDEASFASASEQLRFLIKHQLRNQPFLPPCRSALFRFFATICITIIFCLHSTMSLFSRKATTISISALSAFAGLTLYTQTIHKNRQQKMLPSYEATFSVPLKCESCVSDIKSALSNIDGSSSLHPPAHQPQIVT